MREALKVLAADGLIELLPNRGARIKVLTRAEVGDLMDLMAGLEALAGRLACERITDEEFQHIAFTRTCTRISCEVTGPAISSATRQSMRRCFQPLEMPRWMRWPGRFRCACVARDTLPAATRRANAGARQCESMN
nr:hypothetical protein [Paracoccus sp. WLY502]